MMPISPLKNGEFPSRKSSYLLDITESIGGWFPPGGASAL